MDDEALLRVARFLGRAFGLVPALLAVASREVPDRATTLSESDIRSVGEEFGLSPSAALSDLKRGIADAIPQAPDDVVLRAARRILGKYPTSRGDAVIGILRRLGAP